MADERKMNDELAAEERDPQEYPGSDELVEKRNASSDVPDKDGIASDAENPEGLHGSTHGRWTRPNDRE